jgi:hypothetical protein
MTAAFRFLWLVPLVFAVPLAAGGVAAAEANLKRIQALVEAGVAPRSALKDAEQQLQAARDEDFLRRTLYAGQVAPEDASAMLRAAANLRARAAESLARHEKLVAEGTLTAAALVQWKEQLAHADRQWELARSRARLVEELAEMARREAELAGHTDRERALAFEGKGTLTDEEFLRVESLFLEQFSRPLPVSARGATAVHRSLGYDHRERYDVALSPDQEEGRWLIRLLERLRIPYIAYRGAVDGRSTGAHIHIGLPSPRPAG